MNKNKRKPDWFKIELKATENSKRVKKTVSGFFLHSVCEEAKCPNRNECWGKYKTASFLALGPVCTRNCAFCSVVTGKPGPVDLEEPLRIANSAKELSLSHLVVTMSTRDDLLDGGAGLMAEIIRLNKKENPNCTIEILSSDMGGSVNSIDLMMAEGPQVMSHNLETVRRLSPKIRPQADYDRSLFFLRKAAEYDSSIIKSSVLVGLGETLAELEEAMKDLLNAGVNIINIGQYLQPTKTNAAVERYLKIEEFKELKQKALNMGFLYCESGPLVRSSYHAGLQYEKIIKLAGNSL